MISIANKLEHIRDKITCDKMIDVPNTSSQSETPPDAVFVNRRIFGDISLTKPRLILSKARFKTVNVLNNETKEATDDRLM